MAKFKYRATDRDGLTSSDMIEATSLFDASEKLRSLDLNVVSIEGLDNNRRYEPDGPRPVDVPRDVSLRLRDMPGGLTLLLVGGIFAGVALPLVLSGVALVIAGSGPGAFLALFPLIHLAIGVGILWFMVSRRKRWENLYRYGSVAMAAIDGVGHNRSVRVNGKNPYELAWSFELDGHIYNDKKSSFDQRVLSYAPGDRLWVVYDPEDPEESLEWPPLVG